MNSKNYDSIIAGIIGGMYAAWTSIMLQNNKQQEQADEWHFQDIFESFSGAYVHKIEGYKLKYDVDDSKVKPKYVNVTRTNDWLYTISVDNRRINTIEMISPEIVPRIIELNISDTFQEYLYQGMVIYDTPLIWVYSTESDGYLTITISDQKIEKYDTFNRTSKFEKVYDAFLCLGIEEAQSIAVEMKRYYHNYYDRVKIDNTTYDKLTQDFFPNLSELIDNLKSIDKYPFNEIINILTETKFYNSEQLLYTLFSISNVLQKGYLSKAEKHLEYMLKFDDYILQDSGFDKLISKKLMDVYIELGREKKIRKIINKNYVNDEYELGKLGRELTESGLYNTAVYVYEKIVYMDDTYSNIYKLFEAYKVVNDIISIMELKIKAEAEYNGTGLPKMINDYLKDENYKWRKANGYAKEFKRLNK